MNRVRRRAVAVLKAGVSLGLLALLYRRVDLADLGRTLGQASLAWLPLLAVLMFANTFISAWKWRLLLAADGVCVGQWPLVGSYLVGSFFNLFLPSSIGGDAYRVVDVARRGAKTAGGFASVFADRFTGFLAVAVWGLVFAVIGFKTLPDREILLIPGAVFLVLLAGGWMLGQQRWLLRLLRAAGLERWAGAHAFVMRFFASIAAYRRRPAMMAGVFAISVLFKAVAVAIVGILAHMLGLDVSWLYLAVVVPLVTLIEALPVSIFGLGVRDASYVFFLGAAGVPREEALALTLFYVAVTVLYVAAGGVLFAVRSLPQHAEAGPESRGTEPSP